MGASNAYLFEAQYAPPGVAPVAVSEGSWVVVDPTGRGLRDCFEVGVVLEVREDDEDGCVRAMVALNSGEIVACTDVAAVLS